jgi:hypothetical protein
MLLEPILTFLFTPMKNKKFLLSQTVSLECTQNRIFYKENDLT